MAVKIKLKRLGKTHAPQYRIVVADSRTKRDGRAIEEVGKYHPMEDPSLIEVDSERVRYWLSVGAQPTEPVLAILKVTGDWQAHHGLPGAEGTLRTAEPRADKRATFEAAAKEAGEEPIAEAVTPKPRKAAKSAQPDTATEAASAAEPVAEPVAEPAAEPAAEATDAVTAEVPAEAEPADAPVETEQQA